MHKYCAAYPIDCPPKASTSIHLDLLIFFFTVYTVTQSRQLAALYTSPTGTVLCYFHTSTILRVACHVLGKYSFTNIISRVRLFRINTADYTVISCSKTFHIIYLTMDKLKGFASDAGTFFNRTVQYTEEKLGNAEKTELDAQFDNLQQRADRTKQWTERIISRTEAVLQPNPNRRMEDFVNTKLDRKVPDRETNSEALGMSMIEAGNELGPGTQYGAALVLVGITQKKLGQFEKEFLQTAVTSFNNPLHNFLDNDMKTITKERKILENKRLDLDAAKGKLRKTKSPEAVKLAEAELRVTQSEFDRQYEITKLLLEGISSAHSNHLSRLQYFVEAQQAYFEQCQKAMAELQTQMAKGNSGQASIVAMEAQEMEEVLQG